MSLRDAFVLYGWLRLIPAVLAIMAVGLQAWPEALSSILLWAFCVWRMRTAWDAKFPRHRRAA